MRVHEVHSLAQEGVAPCLLWFQGRSGEPLDSTARFGVVGRSLGVEDTVKKSSIN